MTKALNKIFLTATISIFTIISCNIKTKNSKNNNNCQSLIIGKWYRFSMENGYSEFDIDSCYVTFYNHKVGRFKLPYKIENDSFKYLTHKYRAKITCYDDSIFFQGNDGTIATLYKFKEIPFDSIPDEFKDSILFEQYYVGFKARLIAAFEKAGFIFFDKEENQNNKENKEYNKNEFEKLLKLKNIK